MGEVCDLQIAVGEEELCAFVEGRGILIDI